MPDKMMKVLLRWWQKSNPEFHKTIIDSDNGKTLLHLASEEEGCAEIVKKLIKAGADTNVQDFESRTPLHTAFDDDTAKVLLDNGANINAIDNDKATPLHIACATGDLELAKLLLERGANIEALDCDGESPLCYALRKEENDIFELLLDTDPELVNMIVEPSTGNYPIHLVSEKGNEDMLKLLLRKGAICSVKNKNGYEAIHNATKEGNLNIVKLLIQKNRHTIKAKDRLLNTPLHMAVTYNRFEVVKVLLESGALKDTHNNVRYTPIQIACSFGHSRIVKLLMDYNVSLNIQDENGFTPLHMAVSSKKPDIVQILVHSNRCILNIKNQDGKTPLDLAFEGSQFDTVRMISDAMSKMIDSNEKHEPGSQSENDNQCSICFESKDGIYAFLPCGHACACKKCCDIIKGDRNRNCPICRGKVTQYQKIFISHH